MSQKPAGVPVLTRSKLTTNEKHDGRRTFNRGRCLVGIYGLCRVRTGGEIDALLGTGIPLFHKMKKQIELDLIECKVMKTGCVAVSYRVRKR